MTLELMLDTLNDIQGLSTVQIDWLIVTSDIID